MEKKINPKSASIIRFFYFSEYILVLYDKKEFVEIWNSVLIYEPKIAAICADIRAAIKEGDKTSVGYLETRLKVEIEAFRRYLRYDQGVLKKKFPDRIERYLRGEILWPLDEERIKKSIHEKYKIEIEEMREILVDMAKRILHAKKNMIV